MTTIVFHRGEACLWCVTGLPGSGKTWLVVNAIAQAIRDGAKVLTNIPIKARIPGLTVVPDETVGPKQIIRASEGYRLVVIDEASILWNAREWSEIRGDVFKWLALHRHRGQTLVYIAQSLAQIEASIRRVARYWLRVEDVTTGVLGLITQRARRWRLYSGCPDDSGEQVEQLTSGLFIIRSPALPYASVDASPVVTPSWLRQGIKVAALTLALTACVITASVYERITAKNKAQPEQKPDTATTLPHQKTAESKLQTTSDFAKLRKMKLEYCQILEGNEQYFIVQLPNGKVAKIPPLFQSIKTSDTGEPVVPIYISY